MIGIKNKEGKTIVLGTTTQLINQLKGVAYNKVQIKWTGSKLSWMIFAIEKHNKEYGTKLHSSDLKLSEEIMKSLNGKFEGYKKSAWDI